MTTPVFTLPEPPPDDAPYVHAEWEALRPQMVTDDAMRSALVAWCTERQALWSTEIDAPAWDDAPAPVAAYVRLARAHKDASERFDAMSPLSQHPMRCAVRFFGGEWVAEIECFEATIDDTRYVASYSHLVQNAMRDGVTWGQLRRLASRLYELRATLNRVVVEAHMDVSAIVRRPT